MGKADRLQLRIEADLKEWFQEYAEKRGGMSRVVQDYLRSLKKRNSKDDVDVSGRTGT